MALDPWFVPVDHAIVGIVDAAAPRLGRSAVILGRVIGEITSTINHPFYDERKLLLVARVDPGGTPAGDYLIAVDAVGAGPGDRVLVLDEGNGARQVLDDAQAPVRSVVVGIVDHATVAGRDTL